MKALKTDREYEVGENVDRRNPFLSYDESIIQSFLDSRRILSQSLMSSGKSNTNYHLFLSDNTTVILRLYSQGSAEREFYIMNLVKDLVPVPEEVDRGDGWSIFTFLEGNLLSETPEYSGAAAGMTARIASVTFEGKGWIQSDGTVEPFPFEGGSGFVNEMLERDDVLGWIGPERSDAIQAVMQREKGKLEEMATDCCLVHGDFNPTNILIHGGIVSGVLDWEYSHSGTPYMDIGNLMRNTDEIYHGHIESGLRASGFDLPLDWKDRAQLVDLSSHLEFLTSTRADSFKHQCVVRIDRFLDHFKIHG